MSLQQTKKRRKGLPVPRKTKAKRTRLKAPRPKYQPQPIPVRIPVGLDTETTGSDFRSGCKPYYISIFISEQESYEWEWPVDPFTRQPSIPQGDLDELQTILDNPNYLFCIHNALFDVRALRSIDLTPPPWSSIHCTMVGHHVIASGDSHALKDACIRHLRIPDTDEQDVKEIVTKCQTQARRLKWNLAKKGHEQFPAVSKATWWKLDMWLPAAMADHLDLPDDHPYRKVTHRYGMTDAIRAQGLWNFIRQELRIHNLLPQYLKRKQILPVIEMMMDSGMSFNQNRLKDTIAQFTRARTIAIGDCQSHSIGLKNPASHPQLKKALFEDHELPILKTGKTGPSADKDSIATWLDMDIPPDSRDFILALQTFRKTTKALEALTTYDLAGHPKPKPSLKPTTKSKLYRTLYPGINPTGTDTTRKSSSDPPAQNISKKEGFNLRTVFGPAPGRVWYASDYSNIELRIFGHASGDQGLIQAFAEGFSAHLIIAEVLYPDQYAQCVHDGVQFNKRYSSTLYQWIKNGNFSLIYGAGEEKADLTYHLKGAYKTIRKQLPLIDQFMREKHNEAKHYGYITTVGGYHLQVPRHEPHKAVNYYVQGSAGEAIDLAAVRVYDYLRQFPDYNMIMQVHDELVFDFPIHPRNTKVMTNVVRLMEQSGDDFGYALPVETDIIEDNWSNGKDITPFLV